MPEPKVARLEITVMLKDPDGVHKYETRIPYETDEDLSVLPAIAIAMIRRQGGYFRQIDGVLHVNVIPFERTKDIEIEVFPQLLATDGNVGAAAADAQARQKVFETIRGGKSSGGITLP